MKKAILNRGFIIPVLFLQFIPLVMFPLSSFTLATQEWWLPVLLALFSIYGTIELVVRQNPEPWPWYLIGFSQGFNIISRLLMIMPHITENVGNEQIFNTQYIILTILSMVLSWGILWFTEQPETRMNIYRTAK
jgi:hypothetical protein